MPKLADDKSDTTGLAGTKLTSSTEELLATIQLPPRPTEITEDYEIQALEQQFLRANTSSQSSTSSLDSDTLDSPISPTSTTAFADAAPIPPTSSISPAPTTTLSSDLRRLHANLESRLQPFWSSALSARTIRIHLFASPEKPDLSKHEKDSTQESDGLDHGPIATQDVMTASDGSFQARFTVKWEDMCQHAGALHIAFGNPTQEHDMLAVAELMPAPPPVQSSAPSSRSSRQPDWMSNNSGNSTPPYVPQSNNINAAAVPSAISSHGISLTHSPVRVISDIDDTVKFSNILSGARAVFRNVFVKEMSEIIIPGMGEWYTEMWRKGVRFHYVVRHSFLS